MLIEAFNWIKEHAKNEVIEVNGEKFSTRKLHNHSLYFDLIEFQSLDSLIEYALNYKGLLEPAFHLEDYETVHLVSMVREHKRNQKLASALSLSSPTSRLEQFEGDLDDFILFLMTKFFNGGDRDKLLKLVSNIDSSKVSTNQDDGISQTVTLKAGATLKANEDIKNPFVLIPRCGFPEVSESVGSFVFRLHQDKEVKMPTCTLDWIDIPEWKIQHMQQIRVYLFETLKECGHTGDKILVL